jgi:hypothetical protein
MLRTREVIPIPLEHALLATRVLAVLYAGGETHNTPLLVGALDDASTFLNNIIEGKQFTKTRAVSQSSFDCALAYGEAINVFESLPKQKETSVEVGDFVKRLLDTAQSIKSGRSVEREEVESLIEFFNRVRHFALQANKKPIETVSVTK